jgi:hypothetical protein
MKAQRRRFRHARKGHPRAPGPPRPARLQFDALPGNVAPVERAQCGVGGADVIELDELVVALVGRLADLLHLAVLAEDLAQLLVGHRRVQVEHDQGALVHVLVGRVLLRGGRIRTSGKGMRRGGVWTG